MKIALTNSSSEYSWQSRPKADFYPTPAEVTIALLDFIDLPRSTRIWEPACGDGKLFEVLVGRGYRVRATDIVGGVDFLKQSRGKENWVITNPPFSLAAQFIKKCISLKLDGFALLFKSQFWHASSRLELFCESRPKYVLPLTWRPDFLFGKKGGSPTMEVAWSVWSGYSGSTIYQPLSRPTSVSLFRSRL